MPFWLTYVIGLVVFVGGWWLVIAKILPWLLDFLIYLWDFDDHEKE